MALSKEQKRSLSLIKKSFEKITSNYIVKWTDYERMYDSRHTKKFLDQAKEQDRNAIFIPLTYSTVNIAHSIFTTSFFANGNPIEINNVGDKDKEKKADLSVLVDKFYKMAKPYMELSKAFLSAAIYGTGSVKTYWDSVKKLPMTEMIPASEIGFDVDAISLQDNKYKSYKFMQTLSDIKDRLDNGFYKCEDSHFTTRISSEYERSPYKRKQIREIYVEKKEGYKVYTFCGDVCLREADFKRCEIKSGYLMAKLPSVDTTTRENEIAAIGDSLVRIIKPLNEELNIKRNQRMDMIEKHINPGVFIPVGCSVDEDDIEKIGGVKNCDTTNGIMYEPIAGASEFTSDVMMLKSDIEDASSINGIMRGATNSSDRRSSSAIATISASSSPRLEDMVKTINETLFEPWAKEFVRDCYINADDEFINKLTEKEQHSLGTKGNRPELDIDININFGASINKQAKINDLVSIVQMIGNNPNPNPQVTGLLEEIIKYTLGENVNAKKILGLPDEPGDANNAPEDGGADGVTAQAINELQRGAGQAGNSGQNAGDPRTAELDRLRNNEI